MFSAHRFGGPQGIGMLYARNGVSVTPLIQGSLEEDGRRAGSLNLGLVEGMKTAFLEKVLYLEENLERVLSLVELFKGNIDRVGCITVSSGNNTVPGWVSFIKPGIKGETLKINLEKRGFILSVAPYWNGPEEERPVRLLFSGTNTEEEIVEFLNALNDIEN